MILFTCDLCGHRAPIEERCAAALQTGPRTEEDTLGVRRAPEERFDLCLECALRLATFLKSNQLKIQKEVRS